MSRMERSQGISLAEVLVAITVLGLATTIALVLFDGTRRSFKVGNNLTEQQQVVRIAFDKLSRDVAMAGFNHNPDGQTRPDEAIEAAFDTALVLRADFDAGDPAQSQTPELALASADFPSVSIGNDEIVGYLLAKPGGLGPDTLTFSADVLGVPRDGTVDAINVSSVSTVQDDPPYTLYRITIDENSTTARRVPLVDNVRSLRFTYYDSTGNNVPAPGGADDDAGKNGRHAIQRIGIEIEGLTRDPDSRWIDRDDTNPITREYRKFELFGDVTPLNLGLVGIKDFDASLSPPSKPPPPTLYPGHCKGLWIEWEPNPPQDEVARYEIRYGKSPTSLTGPEYAMVPQYYLASLDDTTEYYVTIEAVDDSGNVSLPSEPASELTTNLNWPKQPTGLVASSNLESVIDLSWDAVSENVIPNSPTADPLYPKMRDFHRYRIHRSDTTGFPANAAHKLDEQVQTTFADHKVVNCKPYYYRVVAADECALEEELHPSDEVQGQSYTIVAPQAPLSVQAYFLPAAGDDVRVIWDPVTRDVAGNPVYIDSYRILRADLGVPTAYNLVYTVYSGVTEWIDTAPPPLVGYKVQAFDACPNFSAESEEALPSCDFTGDVAITQPSDGDTIELDEKIQVTLTGGSGTYSLQVSIWHSGVEEFQTTPGAGPPWAKIPWPPGVNTPGLYRIDATVTKLLDNCVQRTSVQVDLE